MTPTAKLQKANDLKKKLAKTPAKDFISLTFGELGLGQSFIDFPTPGDNEGHGGYRMKYRIFTKTEHKTEKVGKVKFSVNNPHGKAINTRTAENVTAVSASYFPHSMSIIQVE